MNSRIIRQITLLTIILSFLDGAYLYPQMPDRFASHWNASGQVNGYVPKAMGLFLLTAISAILFSKMNPTRMNPIAMISGFDPGPL
jgi:uncharacterized membrane protein